MGGSLRNPAAWNNVFGFRPSPGRVPRRPRPRSVISSSASRARWPAPSPTWRCCSPMQAGYDPRAPLSLGGDAVDFAAPLRRDFSGARIAWLGDLGGYLPMEAGVLASARRAGDFEALGCTSRRSQPDFDLDALWSAWLTLRGLPRRRLAGAALRRRGQPGAAQAGGGLGDRERPAVSAAPRSSARQRHARAWYEACCALFETLRLPGAARRPRSFPSTSDCTGRRRSPAGRWTPTTAGWRW